MPTTLPKPEPSTVTVMARHFLGAALLLVAIGLLWAHLPARAHAVARIGLRLGTIRSNEEGGARALAGALFVLGAFGQL
jgi:hypothetical protein